MDEPLFLDEAALVADDFDLDDYLDEAAGAVRLPPAGVFVDAFDLAEGWFNRTWDKTKHPRWPPGTKNWKGEDIGGQFMKVGQRFMKGGKEWEVAHIVNGRIYANSASHKSQDAKTIALDPKTNKKDGGLDIPDVTPADPHIIKGGGKHDFATSTVPVVDPYVDPSTHDPSIPIPAGSNITQEEWKAFGRLDQEHYVDLMERFGPWKAGAAKGIHAKIWNEYDATLRELVKKAFGNQWGSSTGWTLSLTQMFYHLSPSSQKAAIAQAFEQREKAKELQADLASVIQWDLYNRLQAPDVAIFHNTPDAPSTWVHSFMNGGKAVFSGLSQSTQYHNSTGFFGANTLATPMAIRHVTSNENSVHQSSFGMNENEATIADSFKIEQNKSVAFTSFLKSGAHPNKLTSQQNTWLTSLTQKPRPGAIIKSLIAAMNGTGSLDVPPAPAVITEQGAGGVLYLPPPPDAAKATKDWKLPPLGQAISPEQLGELKKSGGFTPEFAVPDPTHGGPKAIQASEQDFSPGDYMIGKQGGFYWVGNDPGSESGMRYWEIVDGAFTGQSWELTNARKAYRLVGPGGFTFPEPPPDKDEDDTPDFNPDDWAPTKEDFYLGHFKAGDKFKFQGTYWEVTDGGSGPGGPPVKLANLITGKLATINPDSKLPKLVGEAESKLPTPAEVAPTPEAYERHPVGAKVLVKPAWGDNSYPGVVKAIDSNLALPYTVEYETSPGNFSTGQYNESSLHKPPQPPFVPYEAIMAGDTFAFDGKKYTVTNVLKNGVVKAKASGGKVESFTDGKNDSHPLGLKVINDDTVLRPTDWVHDPGDKKKIKDVTTGDVFDVGTGAKLRPALALIKNYKGVYYRDLDTGKTGFFTNKKLVRSIIPKGEVDPTVDGVTPDAETAAGEGKFDKDDYMPGPMMTFKAMPVGTLFEKDGAPFKKTEPNEVMNLQTGSKLTAWKTAKSEAEAETVDLVTLVPKASSGVIPYELLSKGDPAPLNSLKVGDQFQFTATGAQFALQGFSEDGDGNAMADVALVMSSGHYGPVHQVPADSAVEFFAKGPMTTGAEEVDTASFPSALSAGFQPYKSKWGSKGKYVHEQIKDMAVGTHFRGTEGKEWIVKQSGPHAVISDGEKNYAVDGKLRGRVLDKENLIDSAPPVGVVEVAPEPAVTVAGQAKVEGLQGVVGKTLGDLKVGDKFAFVSNGKVWTVTDVSEATGVTAKDIAVGDNAQQTASWGDDGKIEAWLPAGASWSKKGTDLNVGDQFTLPSSEDWKYEFVAHATGSKPAQIKVVATPEGVPVGAAQLGEVIPWGTAGETPDLVTTVWPPEKTPGPPAPSDADAPWTVKAAQNAGYYTATGEKKAPSELEDFELVQLTAGLGGGIGYARHGKLFKLGDGEVKTKAKTLKVVEWTGPSLELDALQDGDEVSLAQVPIGGWFRYKANEFQVIGRTPDGVTGLALSEEHKGEIAFSEDMNTVVTRLVPKVKEPLPSKAEIKNTLSGLTDAEDVTIGNVKVTKLPQEAGVAANWLMEKPGEPPIGMLSLDLASDLVKGAKWPGAASGHAQMGQTAKEYFAAFEDDLGLLLETWPEDVPLPTQGAGVEFYGIGGEKLKGTVVSVTGDTYTIYSPGVTSDGDTLDIPVEDLIGPSATAPVPPSHQTEAQVYGQLEPGSTFTKANGAVVIVTGKGDETVSLTQIGPEGQKHMVAVDLNQSVPEAWTPAGPVQMQQINTLKPGDKFLNKTDLGGLAYDFEKPDAVFTVTNVQTNDDGDVTELTIIGFTQGQSGPTHDVAGNSVTGKKTVWVLPTLVSVPSVGDSITSKEQMDALPVGSEVGLSSLSEPAATIYKKGRDGLWHIGANGYETNVFPFNGTYKVKAVGEGPEPAAGPSDPLEPFKSTYGTGGTYKHEKLKDLAPGTVFVDKKKNEYTLQSVDGDVATFSDSAGTTYQSSSKNRVKVVSQPQAGPKTTPVASKVLKVGEVFEDTGMLWKVTGHSDTHTQAEQLEPHDPAKSVAPASLGVPLDSEVNYVEPEDVPLPPAGTWVRLKKGTLYKTSEAEQFKVLGHVTGGPTPQVELDNNSGSTVKVPYDAIIAASVVKAPKSPSGDQFFDKLDVGDFAVMQVGSGPPKYVVVTNNQIAGTDIEVKKAGFHGAPVGAPMTVEAGDLLPPDALHTKYQPGDKVYVEVPGAGAYKGGGTVVGPKGLNDFGDPLWEVQNENAPGTSVYSQKFLSPSGGAVGDAPDHNTLPKVWLSKLKPGAQFTYEFGAKTPSTPNPPQGLYTYQSESGGMVVAAKVGGDPSAPESYSFNPHSTIVGLTTYDDLERAKPLVGSTATVIENELRVGDQVKIYDDDVEPHVIAKIGEPGETYTPSYGGPAEPLGLVLQKPNGELWNVGPEYQVIYFAPKAGKPEVGDQVKSVGPMPTWAVGETITDENMDALQVGDLLTSTKNPGTTYTVTKKADTGFQFEPVGGSGGPFAASKGVGYVFDGILKYAGHFPPAGGEPDYGAFEHGDFVKNKWGDVFTVVAPPDDATKASYAGLVPVVDAAGKFSGYKPENLSLADLGDVPTVATQGGDAAVKMLDFYGSPYGSGGSYKHEKINDLEPLTKFKDKSGSVYTFVSTVGDEAYYMDAGGTTYKTPIKVGKKPVRVRVVEPPAGTYEPPPHIEVEPPIPGGFKKGDLIIQSDALNNGPARVIKAGEGGLQGHIIAEYTTGPLKGVEGAFPVSKAKAYVGHSLQEGDKWLDASGNPFTVESVEANGDIHAVFDNGYTAKFDSDKVAEWTKTGVWKPAPDDDALTEDELESGVLSTPKTMQDLKVGDTVWSPDPESGEGYYPMVVDAVNADSKGVIHSFHTKGGTYNADDDYVVFDEPEGAAKFPYDETQTSSGWLANTPLPSLGDWVEYALEIGSGLGKVIDIDGDAYTVEYVDYDSEPPVVVQTTVNKEDLIGPYQYVTGVDSELAAFKFGAVGDWVEYELPGGGTSKGQIKSHEVYNTGAELNLHDPLLGSNPLVDVSKVVGSASPPVGGDAPAVTGYTKGIPDYSGTDLDLSKTVGAGGTQGAKWATGPNGEKWLVKQYKGDEDRVATEILGNAIYREMGAKAAPAGKVKLPNGKWALTYPGLDGEVKKITGPSAKMGEHYMTDALLANWDFIGATDDNILWGPDGEPFRVDQGGVLFYRAKGTKKPFNAGGVKEVSSMLNPTPPLPGQGHGKVTVTYEGLIEQAGDIFDTLTHERIDELVDAAPFADEKLREDTRKALKARRDWMGKVALGTVKLPDDPWMPKPSGT